MTEKEIKELRRRFNAEKTNMTTVRGCMINEKKEIVTRFTQSITLSAPEESAKLMAIMKKCLSGSRGTNLIDIVFRTEQVVKSEEHELLMRLKTSALKDEEAVEALYAKIAENYVTDSKYIVLLSSESYDVFGYHEDGKRKEDSDWTYSYIICAICPMKTTKPELSFITYDNAFKTVSPSSVISSPNAGFLFPAFDNRAENIYNALFYARDTHGGYDELIDALFKTEPPMPAAVQEETFADCLRETVGKEYGIDIIRAVHEQIEEVLEEHKISREEDEPELSRENIAHMLKNGGAEDSAVEAFERKYDEEFGSDAMIKPQNIVNTRRFEVETPDVTIRVNPQRRDLVSTRIIDGTKYILVRAAEGVCVNGVDIDISE